MTLEIARRGALQVLNGLEPGEAWGPVDCAASQMIEVRWGASPGADLWVGFDWHPGTDARPTLHPRGFSPAGGRLTEVLAEIREARFDPETREGTLALDYRGLSLESVRVSNPISALAWSLQPGPLTIRLGALCQSVRTRGSRGTFAGRMLPGLAGEFRHGIGQTLCGTVLEVRVMEAERYFDGLGAFALDVGPLVLHCIAHAHDMPEDLRPGSLIECSAWIHGVVPPRARRLDPLL